jgi:hypothetical protein
MNNIPESSLLRISQILGNPKKGLPPIIPVSATTWWKGVKEGKFPRPVKLSYGVTCWRSEDIRALVESFGQAIQGGKV